MNIRFDNRRILVTGAGKAPLHETTLQKTFIAARTEVGLSKVPRLVDMFARRLQVQERLTVQIAEKVSAVQRSTSKVEKGSTFDASGLKTMLANSTP